MRQIKKNIKVAAALITKDGKILLARRAKGELAGFWEFPGGKIEKGETPEEAIIREIKEELGIEVEVVKVIGTFQHEYDFAVIKMTLIECKIPGPNKNIKLDESHIEIKWVKYDDNSLELTPLDKEIFTNINN